MSERGQTNQSRERSDGMNQREQERAERFAVIDRVRDAFQGVPPEHIERETDRIIAGDRAAARAAMDDEPGATRPANPA